MTSVVEIEGLCGIMQRFGLTRLVSGDVTLERPAFAVAMGEVKTKDEEPDDDDELTKISRMSPDAIDRALALSPTTGAK